MKKNEYDNFINIKGTYKIHIQGYDWGAATNKVIVSLDKVIDKVSINNFIVTETNQTTNFGAKGFPIEVATVSRQIVDVYLSDENGNKVDEPSKHVFFELKVSPSVGSPFLFSMATMFNTYSDPYYLTISMANEANLTSEGKEIDSINIDTKYIDKTTSANMFDFGEYKAIDGVTYQYASYTPETKSDTLVVWLHGMGEGGTKNTDPSIVLLANKAAYLADEKFQSIIGNAHILAPQSPTYWMDTKGDASNFNSGGIKAEATSFYTQSLEELIDYYKEEVKANKVVLIGASNGGYMTMVLGINRPEKYKALIAICEALPDSFITNEQIESLVDLPIYFVTSLDDKTVIPEKHTISTFKRLKKANAKNVQIALSENVIDKSGKVLDAKGNPYKYNGHWSWIYFFNDDTLSDNNMSAFEWLAKILGN